MVSQPEEPAAAVAAVEACVPYLRATVLPDGDGDGEPTWHRCADLLADPSALADLVSTTGPGRGSEHPQVLASLFAQSYAFRVASVAVAGWLLDRRVVDPHPAHTAIAITRSRPGRLGLVGGTTRDDDTGAWLVERLVGDHLAPLVDALRSTTLVGERLLWGDVVASLVAVLRAVEGAVPVERKAGVRADGERLLALTDDASGGRTDGLGAFVVLGNEHHDGWFWERTTCCLWYRTGEAERLADPASRTSWCDDCSLTTTADRRAAFLAGLTG